MRELKVGIIGCGDILHAHVVGWGEVQGAQIHGFYDVDEGRMRAAVAKVPGALAFESAEALIAGCDVVDLCSPPSVHRGAAVAALEGGRHVLIEKPVVVELADWQAIREAAHTSQGTLSAVYQQKFSSHAERAQQLFDEGRVGVATSVDCAFFVEPATDEMLVHPGHWAHSLPGGRWFEVLPHLLYLIHGYTGALRLGGVAVHRGDSVAGAPAEAVSIALEGARCPATIRLSARCALNRRELVVTGEKGVIELSILGGVATCTRLGRVGRARGVGLVGVPFVEAGAKLLTQFASDRVRHLVDRRRTGTNHGRLMRAFVGAINGGPNPTPITEIDSVLGVCAEIGLAIDAALALQKRST